MELGKDRVVIDPVDEGWLVTMSHAWTALESVTFTVLVRKSDGKETLEDLQRRAVQDLKNRLG